MSSSITEEQRRRMEENRQKALARRAAAEGSQGQGQGHENMERPSTTSVIGQKRPIDVYTRPSTASSTSSSSSFNSRPSTANSTTTTKPFENRSNLSMSSTTSTSRPTSAKTISGCASMITRDRFKVDMPFHTQSVAIFKSIPGAQYDPQTKSWNFPLQEHGKLITGLESLKPDVVFGPLPSFVLKIFRSHPSSVEPNLSNIDPVLLSSLMPFQRDGVVFGIQRGGRVLIADDMGLGKTIQALGIAHYYFGDWPLLIVAPSSMRYRWRESIWDWLPSIPPGAITVVESPKDSVSSSRVVILSYDILQKRQEELSVFKTVIMDESHHLKNSKTARTKSALPLLQNARRAILLSGTPALSRPIELFPQIQAVNKGLFPSAMAYGIRYCDGKKNAWAWDYSGSSNMPELNLILRETLMIRRLKTEVLKQLPPKLRNLVILESKSIDKNNKGLVAREQAYNNAKNATRLSQAEKRGKLLEYYSETAKVKLPAVCAYIQSLLEDEKKFLVFGHHQQMLDGITEHLEEMHIKYIRIDGKSSAEDRQYCVDQFQSREDIRVAVLSITAANSGITLTAAGLVIFAELYWNPGILTQAEDRAHRIGQGETVVVKYLLAKGTADDVLWPMIQSKLDVLNKAGLSKDNFEDAEAVGYFMPASTLSKDKADRTIDQYFPSSQSQSQNQMSQASENVDLIGSEEMNEDDDILMQIINESFD